MNNEYDEGYLRGLHNLAANNYYAKNAAGGNFGAGFNDASKNKARDPTLSSLAKDVDYQNFCQRAASAMGGSAEYISVRWCSGGITGGSCWSDSKADTPVPADPPEELSQLDVILEQLCPNISFLTYKLLVKEVVKYAEDNNSDYYGNVYNYSIKYLVLPELYAALKQRNMI